MLNPQGLKQQVANSRCSNTYLFNKLTYESMDEAQTNMDHVLSSPFQKCFEMRFNSLLLERTDIKNDST